MSNARSAILVIYFALHLLNLTHGKHLSTHLEICNLLLSTLESFIWVYIISISAQLLWHHQQMDWVRPIFVRTFAIQMFCRRNRMYTIHTLKLLNKKLFLTPLPQILKRREKKKWLLEGNLACTLLIPSLPFFPNRHVYLMPFPHLFKELIPLVYLYWIIKAPLHEMQREA